MFGEETFKREGALSTVKPFRKQFDALPSFPFAIDYREKKNYRTELTDHLHDWYELVYVHSGAGAFFIDRSFDEMREGDLFAIPGNTIHRAFPDKENPVTSTAVFFSPILIQQISLGEPFSYLRCFEQGRARRRFKLDTTPALRREIEACVDRMHDELAAGRPGFRHAVTLLLHQLLLAIHRETSAAAEARTHDIGPEWMKDILLYIDGHYCEDIGLAELSARASVSPAHFSRLFKQLTGMNVTAFIAAKRMIRAKELLLATSDGVGAIAAACGFESLPHFHRLFKRIVGTTPSAYRREASS